MAKSDLPLRIIELQHFPYCKAFEDLLKAKGHGLHELLFRAINSLNSKHILYIGKHCKALQRLHIKELGPEEDQTMVLMTASKLFRVFFGYREGYLLLQEVAYCTGITKPPEVIFFLSLCIFLSAMFPSSKVHSIRAYILTY